MHHEERIEKPDLLHNQLMEYDMRRLKYLDDMI